VIRRGRRVQLRWGGNVWFRGADGERQAVRVDSRDTHGAYSVIESVAGPGCAVPTHRRRKRGRALPRDLRSLPNCHWRPDSRCTARNSCDGPSKHAAQLAECRRGGKPAAGDPHPGRIRADRLRGQSHPARKDPRPGYGAWLRHLRTTGPPNESSTIQGFND